MDDIFWKQNIETILDYIGEGIQVIDAKGCIQYYNRSSEELDDIRKTETIGKHVLEVYPSLSPQTSTLLNAIEKGIRTYDMQQTYINYKGKKITTVNSSFPIRVKDKIVGAIEISRNITDVKELSEKVVDLQEQLLDKKKNTGQKENKDGAKYTFYDIIGESKSMLKTKKLAEKASQSSSPILIYGETGTGKELFVHAIHNRSGRRKNPFIAQNCGALPATLLESILFGTVKGSFTGADNRAGLFELANGGTLFLDEINSMPLELQVKLLRVLQDGNIRRVGDIKTRQVDVRIVAASNEDPLVAVENKRLRRDLYYRLNVVGLRLPRLKERTGDISILVEFFIDKFNKELNKHIKGVSDHVLDVFEKYDWLGNVRELEHVIEGAMNFMDGDRITTEDLPYIFDKIKDDVNDKVKVKTIGIAPLKESIENFERDMIEYAMDELNDNISHTAKRLQIPRQTLQYKIKKYGIRKPSAEN